MASPGIVWLRIPTRSLLQSRLRRSTFSGLLSPSGCGSGQAVGTPCAAETSTIGVGV